MAVAMERGTRLVNLFQNIDKLSSGRASGKVTGEDAQQLRYTVSKLLQYVTGQEKIHRDIILKNSIYLDQLLVTLECCAESCVQQNIVIILNELIGKTQTSKRVSMLVAHGTTQVLFSVLVEESREQQASEDLMLCIHHLLAKLGPKDRKFSVKARLSQALPVTVGMIRNYINNAKPLQCLLHVLKLYASNAVNVSYLGKNGVVTHLFKILAVCGKKHLTVMKYALDTLSLLVKSKSNSARAIGQGGVPILLTMFFDWHRMDTKNRHLALRKAVLHVLKHITNLKSGRKALMDADGIRILYTACQESIDSRESETIIVLSSHVMRKCFPKNRLAVTNLFSALVFPLPISDFHVSETGGGQNDSAAVGAGLTTLHPHQLQPSVDEYESSLDNDDDVSSDGDGGNRRTLDSEEDTDADVPSVSPYRRTWDNLSNYKTLFPELHEFDSILEENQMPLPQEIRPIIIPTATQDLARRPVRLKNNQSASTLCLSKRQNYPSRHSISHMEGYHAGPDFLKDAISDLSFNDVGSWNSILDTQEPHTRGHPRVLLKNLASYEASVDGSCDDGGLPSAVNLTSGMSVVSLNVNTLTSPLGSVNKKGRSVRPQTRERSQETIQHIKEKRSRSRSKADEWFNDFTTSVMEAAKGETYYDNSDDDTAADPEEGEMYGSPEVYQQIAAQTRSVGCFNKVAYPDMYGHLPLPYREPLHEKKFGIQRAKVFEDIDRFINPDQIIDRIVYDLDAEIATAGPAYTCPHSTLNNKDEIRVTHKDESVDHLQFNSQFESGNLRKAIQVRQYEYDLILSPDINTNHHHQWFYFEVSNMEAGMPYRFNIVNCEKLNSQFNFGMRPVMYSVCEAMRGRPYWIRAGTEICYYKNHFTRSTQTTGGVRGKSYYTASFTINFKHDQDVVYLAYHYPYTYTMLQVHLYRLEQTYDSGQVYFKNQSLCDTLGGNRVPLLTITSHPVTYDREGIDMLKNRQYIFLSSRVHPGESNASWVMKGTIEFLLSNDPTAQALRDMYIFKVVPMLNPDGVINGSHRCSLVAEDLNRRWLQPCPRLHPTIYHTKGLLQYLACINKVPLVFCDYHGHSRRKNVFLYGCSPTQSWMTEDLDNPAMSGNKLDDNGYKTLPKLLQAIAPAFSLSNCSFMVEKSKESTARVVVWRQIGIVRSYTMESSYCGCDQGPYKNTHISSRELEEMGKKFCEALVKVRSRHSRRSTSPLAATNNSAGGQSGSVYGSTSEDIQRMCRDQFHVMDQKTTLSTSSSSGQSEDFDGEGGFN